VIILGVLGAALIAVVVGVGINVLSEDASGWLGRFACWLVRGAAAKLSEAARERYEAEWLAELAAAPGPLSRVWHAATIRWSVGGLAGEVGSADAASGAEGRKLVAPVNVTHFYLRTRPGVDIRPLCHQATEVHHWRDGRVLLAFVNEDESKILALCRSTGAEITKVITSLIGDPRLGGAK
jgi:hypothetical protein